MDSRGLERQVPRVSEKNLQLSSKRRDLSGLQAWVVGPVTSHMIQSAHILGGIHFEIKTSIWKAQGAALLWHSYKESGF